MNPDKDRIDSQSIGKRCFESCYKIACEKGDNLTVEDLIEHDPKLKGTKETGLRTRLSCIKIIVREGWADEALSSAKNRRQYQ